MSDQALYERVAELEAKLAEAEATARALASGEIDAVAMEGGTVLIHAAQQRLRANERLLRAIFDGAMDAMLIADDSGRYVDANPAACSVFGLTKELLLGRHLADFAAPGYESGAQWQSFIAEGRMRGEFPLLRADGTRRDLEFLAVTHVLPGLHLSVLRDVTERKASETTLLESQRMLEEAQAVAHVGSWASGKTPTHAITWSPECARIFGGDPSNPPTADALFERIHVDDRPAVIAAVRRAIIDGAPMETEHRIVLPSGEVRWVYKRSIVKGLIPSNDGEATAYRAGFDASYRAIGIVQDVTDRHRADETRNQLAAIVESSNDAIIGMTLETTITSWNRAACKLFGYAAKEIVGKSVLTLLPQERADEESAILDLVRRGEPVRHYETVRRRKDGVLVDVDLTVSPVFDTSGALVAVSKMVRDISERRKAAAALLRSEEQLRQSQKMEAIGNLAGGVAHDFNNLLSVIISYTSLIVEGLAPADPMRADLEEVHSAGLRATELTRQLLAFSRKQILQPSAVDVNAVLRGVEKMLGRIIGEDIDLRVHGSPDTGRAFVDPGQLEQVIMNLVVNARDAMPRGGSITIETSSVFLDEVYAASHSDVTPGPHVLLAVTDTGVGMDQATRSRAFEPFFTTKEQGKGTGLGLSTVYGIVRQSGSHIWLYSEPGRGTTFKIYLPRTDRVDTATEPEPANTLRGSETILLVEDEAPVRHLMRSILQKHGYHILEAQNGGEAFLLCEQFSARIHLLLTDVVMPRMTGRQLADRLAVLRPEMRILFVSGYTENTIVHQGVLDAGVEFLAKPILPNALLKKVRQVLDGVPRRSNGQAPG